MIILKLTETKFNTGNIANLYPIYTSVEIKTNPDVNAELGTGIKEVIHEFYLEKNNGLKITHEQIVHTSLLSREEMKEYENLLSNLNLPELKNNYFSNDVHQYSHWIIEYGLFKIVGTFDQKLPAVEKIEEILRFQQEKAKCRQEVEEKYKK